MASAVAHGIRNPLSSIRSSVELALDGGSGHLRDCSHDVIAEVDRMEKWVRELLNYSRPVSGGIETVDLNPIIRRSLDNFAREIGKRSVAVSTQLAEALPTVRGHPSMLGQAFNSLIANALDAMSERTQLTVASRLADDRRHVEVSINDTGTGIAAPELSKVLKPFYTTKTEGMGLGLPLAQRIVERYGGTLAIASTAGAGTTVTLQLVAAV
jgi:two-component system sensor histidine kinase HydH